MSRSVSPPPRCALSLKHAEGIARTPGAIGRQLADARQRVSDFPATRVSMPTLCEIYLAMFIGTRY